MTVLDSPQRLVAGQSVFDRSNNDRKCKDREAEDHRASAAFFSAPSHPITNHSDDARARIAGPIELAGRRRDQNRDADHKRDGSGRAQLDCRDDLITPGKPPVVNQPPGNAKREQMGEG
jgi:hypothetical protein